MTVAEVVVEQYIKNFMKFLEIMGVASYICMDKALKPWKFILERRLFISHRSHGSSKSPLKEYFAKAGKTAPKDSERILVVGAGKI